MRNITENLRNLDTIGFARGGFAILHKAILHSDSSPGGQVVAVKFLDLHKIDVGDDASRADKWSHMALRWHREIRAGEAVQHPNVLPFLGFCDNPNPAFAEFVGIVLPFYKNGDANTYIRRHAIVDRMRILVGIGAAIFALHCARPPVVHGDIKGANILIDDAGNPCLSDFGLSRICETEGFTTDNVMGTCRWMSSELLQAIAMDEPISTSTASDIWAFGMTILEILTGRAPFSEMRKDGAVFLAVVTGAARPERPDNSVINSALWLLLQRCWQGDPASRPDARHVCLALDIIYGSKNKDVPYWLISRVLDGTWDHVVQSPIHGNFRSASLPYRCKWLNCTRAFSCIDNCIEHECEEFAQRRRTFTNSA